MREAIPLNTSYLSAISLKTIGEHEVEVPTYSRTITRRICHLGVGAFHRSHQAVYLHKLLQRGLAQGWGICGIGLRPEDQRVHQALLRQDYLFSVWELEGTNKRSTVIGSIMDYVDASTDISAALAVLSDSETCIVSLTITEAGYCLLANGDLNQQHEDIVHDLAHLDAPRSAPGLIVRALQMRRDLGRKGFTLMSCDNLIENGHRLRDSVIGFSKCIDPELAQWIEREVSFPCSMVDRITPALEPAQRQQFENEWGVKDDALIMCESWQQWILEDKFVAGRPEFEQVGVVISKNVPAYEDMKVGLLNGGHSALSHISLLMGYSQVHEALTDSRLRAWLVGYMQEVSQTLEPIAGINFSDYQTSLIRRFSNPAIADRLTRLAQDSSAKFQQTLLPPLVKRLSLGLSTTHLAATIAFWIHYLGMLKSSNADRDAYLDPRKDELINLAAHAIDSQDPSAFVAATLQLSPAHAERFNANLALQLHSIQKIDVEKHAVSLESTAQQP
ncbi:mannitol dehydrogenase family protein [Stenotrophobium rhamnosiphilum]|uniref:Mannitol dehydrogenase n=1 Tax=Stenotrophobium rhamnosiphilum TaxID=2029166 RepID=A0A2T5MGZ1_9GAMM|nr:mannitol dehydrogenase family protein [Stenotrophobium rhamnosiphilum]PTU31852.1 mannitol dehydrogenase [Stenotrophobium rhamnosiphilum]